MSHTFTADGGLCDLDAAAVADDPFVADLLILAAVAFPVLGRSENALAEKAILFRLESTVINGLRLFDLSMGPFADLIRRSQTDTDRIKSHRLVLFLLIVKFCHICLPFEDSQKRVKARESGSARRQTSLYPNSTAKNYSSSPSISRNASSSM